MADLAFDEASHTYRLEGRVVPSVTQVLDPLYDFSRVPPEVLERKRQLGTAVHKAVELDIAGTLDPDSIAPELDGYLRAWAQFKASGFHPQASELRLASKSGYAGTLDLICTQGPDVWLIDIKTAAQHSPVMALQTAAYAQLYAEHDPARATVKRGAVLLAPDGTFNLIPHTDRSDLRVFLSLLTIHQWRKTHGVQ